MIDVLLTEERVEAAFPGRLFLRPSLTTPHLIYIQEKVGSSLESIAANLKDKNVRQAMSRADARRSASECLATTMMISKAWCIPCVCKRPVYLEIHEHASTKCVCGKEHFLAYWPSPDRLVSYLQMGDPLRTDQLHRVRKVDQAAAEVEYHNRRMTANDAGAIFGDALIEQIPSFGYSGATKAWVDAPTSPGVK